jgi:hypothetical protein
VLREKARFVHRWPERSYRPRPSTLSARCDTVKDEPICFVTGLVDFDCRSAERHAVSTGVARFTATVWFGGEQPQIIGETSEVIG